MKFSQRIGIIPVETALQTQGMNDDLRNSLWNVLDARIWRLGGFLYNRTGRSGIRVFGIKLWKNFFKKPVDTLSDNDSNIFERIRNYYFECKWHEVYDFIEYVLSIFKLRDLVFEINNILERELSGYRVIGGVFVPVTDEVEVEAIQEALYKTPYSGVRAHLKQAMQLLSSREYPDYRNSIKESISAVESMAYEVTGKPKASLGDALKLIEKDGHLHPALKKGFSALYGYTSDEDGIRHAMLEEPDLSVTDAKFFLISCSAFINYLKVKIDKK